jgi:hypothetical protein
VSAALHKPLNPAPILALVTDRDLTALLARAGDRMNVLDEGTRERARLNFRIVAVEITRRATLFAAWMLRDIYEADRVRS